MDQDRKSDRAGEREEEVTSSSRPTAEVASEGGSPGNVEIESEPGAGTGSEATEVWSGDAGQEREVKRDETGTGRRNP